MRLAFANSSHIWGGAEHITATFLRGLQDRGHDVALLCRRGSPFIERIGNDVRCIPTLGGFDANPPAVLRSMRALSRTRAQLLMTMTQKDPRTAGVAARLVGIPVLVRWPMDLGFRQTLRHRLFYGVVPTHYVANSLATRTSMVESVPWLAEEDVAVIYNGVDTERFAQAEPADLGTPPGAVVVGWAGRFEDRKGIREVMQAWPRIAAEVPDAFLVLAGDSGPHHTLVREWAQAQPRVRLLGFRDDMPAVMKALDVLLVPSWYEGFGLVVAEAMAAARPVIATRISNLPELLDDGVEGRLVPVQDADALASATIQLASDAELRATMGRAGQTRARRDFSFARMLDEYELLLDSIVAGERRPAAAQRM